MINSHGTRQILVQWVQSITKILKFGHYLEGEKKKFTNVFLLTAKMIDPRVKNQARGQNNGSRALK